MARFDLNRDGKKDIFDSMIEYEIYKDVMGEDDEITPSSFSRKKYLENHKKTKKNEDGIYQILGWVLIIVLTIAPYFVFRKLGVGIVTAFFWSIGVACLVILLIPHEGSDDTNDEDYITMIGGIISAFLLGLFLAD